jgi:hypothetical protein
MIDKKTEKIFKIPQSSTLYRIIDNKTGKL